MRASLIVICLFLCIACRLQQVAENTCTLLRVEDSVSVTNDSTLSSTLNKFRNSESDGVLFMTVNYQAKQYKTLRFQFQKGGIVAFRDEQTYLLSDKKLVDLAAHWNRCVSEGFFWQNCSAASFDASSCFFLVKKGTRLVEISFPAGLSLQWDAASSAQYADLKDFLSFVYSESFLN